MQREANRDLEKQSERKDKPAGSELTSQKTQKTENGRITYIVNVQGENTFQTKMFTEFSFYPVKLLLEKKTRYKQTSF